MRVRLGLIVPAEAHALFRRGLQGLSGVEPKWGVYPDEESIASTVQAILPDCDALCFAGPLSLERARPLIPEDLPFAEVKPTSVDIALSFLRARAVGMGITPVSIDSVGPPMVSDLLAELGVRNDGFAVLPFDNDATPEQVAEFHREQRSVIGARYALTARNSVFRLLDGASDIPVIRIESTASTITATVRELSLRAVSVRKEDLRLCAVVFRLADPPTDEHARRRCVEVISRILSNSAGWKDGWVDVRRDSEVLVLGHKKLMEEATNQWRSLDVLSELGEQAGSPIVAGFGLGESIQKCIRYAEFAADRAGQVRPVCAYLMTQEGLVIGPMREAKTAPLRFRYKSEDVRLENLSQRIGLGMATLSRLIDLENKLAGESISARELGERLSLTPTSGRRILRTLRAGGVVTPVGQSEPHRRGRPQSLYRMRIQEQLEDRVDYQ